jgi:cytochrome bd ubiquinol oxidase subunit I
LVFIGSWLSGYLIVATDAWMQYPTAYRVLPNGEIGLSSFWGLVLNRWALAQYAHNMRGAVQTGCFVMAAVGAFYILSKRELFYGKTFVRMGVIVGVIAAVLQLFPTGDIQGKLVADHQSVTLAAMGGSSLPRKARLSRYSASLTCRNVTSTILSKFLPCSAFSLIANGKPTSFPEYDWPDTIELLYYSYHVMVGLGTIFIAIMGLSAIQLRRRKLYETRWLLWILMLSVPLPYIANTAGWMTAELGRQPWLIYGVMRTAHGYSPRVAAGNAWFTLLGFMGMYTLLAILWLFLVYREIENGPQSEALPHAESPALMEAD